MNCTRCKKSKSEVYGIAPLSDDNVFICNECIDALHASLHKKSKPKNKKNKDGVVPSYSEIVEHLNKYIVGQEKAKDVLTVAIRNHVKMSLLDPEERKNMDKTNILLVGDTGTGKTAIINRLAEAVSLPYVVVDANSLTASGYMGTDVTSVIRDLYERCNKNKALTEKAIVVIDEIDKKRKKVVEQQKDLGGEEVQKELLKIIEGTEVKVGTKEYIDTSNILFVFSGAFVGLSDIIEERKGKKGRAIGFGHFNDAKQIDESIVSDDIINFGLIPELVGRIPVIVQTNALTESDLIRIITETDNNIYSQYQKLFQIDGIELKIHDKVLQKIASDCFKDKIGVRGLRKQFEKILHDPQRNIEKYHEKGVVGITLNRVKDSDTIRIREIKNR